MRTRFAVVLAALAVVSSLACRDDGPTGLAGTPRDGRVFIDNFISSDFQAFAGSKVDAVQLDNAIKFRGSSSLRVTIPAPGDATGGYAGGAFVASQPRDLSEYNALTFYARASVNAALNVAGLGNDNTGTSLFNAERNAIPLTTTWQKVIIPIPLAARLTAERGLFFFAEGAEGASGYDLWLDDIQFETLTNLTNVRPAVVPATINAEVGSTATLSGFTVTTAVDATDVIVSAAPAYFSFASSNTNVATVSTSGVVNVGAAGSTNITATLGSTAVTGAIAINATTAPTVAAANPTRPAGEVISLFSGAYTNVTVDTWSADWDAADVTDVTIAGNTVKRYSNLVFAGIEFITNRVDATSKGALHLDVYVSDVSNFRVKLVDFGADGAFAGGDDSEHEVILGTGGLPTLTAGTWNSIDIPFSAFVGLTSRANLAQMIIVGSSPTTYIDNVYFYDVAAPPPPATEPTVAAPTPAYAAGDVISLFSNAYTNVAVNTWRTDWSDATLTDLQIAGNDTKRYTGLNFVGIETVGANLINATSMTHFRIDVWTPDAITGTASLRIKLVDFGANGAYDGPGVGYDREHEVVFDATTTPSVTAGTWITLDIPLSSFTGLTTRGNLAQFIISGTDLLNTLFVDNVLLHR